MNSALIQIVGKRLAAKVAEGVAVTVVTKKVVEVIERQTARSSVGTTSRAKTQAK
jgi:hypothetical protein